MFEKININCNRIKFYHKTFLILHLSSPLSFPSFRIHRAATFVSNFSITVPTAVSATRLSRTRYLVANNRFRGPIGLGSINIQWTNRISFLPPPRIIEREREITLRIFIKIYFISLLTHNNKFSFIYFFLSLWQENYSNASKRIIHLSSILGKPER